MSLLTTIQGSYEGKRRGFKQLMCGDANEIFVAKKALYSMSLLTGKAAYCGALCTEIGC